MFAPGHMLPGKAPELRAARCDGEATLSFAFDGAKVSVSRDGAVLGEAKQTRPSRCGVVHDVLGAHLEEGDVRAARADCLRMRVPGPEGLDEVVVRNHMYARTDSECAKLVCSLRADACPSSACRRDEDNRTCVPK